MPVAPIPFQPEHALEVVLYVVKRLRYPTFHSVSKILYFADREHLSRYGSLLTGDNYVAMRLGPVPSAIYNLMKAAAGKQEPQIPPSFYALVEKALGVVGPYRLKPLRGANLKYLSTSQRACLDESVRTNGRLSLDSLTRKSHDAAWKSAQSNEFIDVRAIAKTLKNGKDILSYLSEQASDEHGETRQRVLRRRAA